MRDRARQGFDFFVSQGYSPAAAAGILGNFVQESRLNPGARNPGDGSDGSDSIGLGQWNSGRAQNLSRFSRANGLNPQDFETQLRFTDWELRNTHRGARDALMSAKNPTEAAAAFVTQFERPKGSNRGAEYAHGWGTRNAHANAIFGAYGQGVPARQEAPRQQATGMVELLDDADAPAQNAQPVGFQIPEGLSQSDPRVTGQSQPGMVELLDDEPSPRLQPSQGAPAQGQRPRVRVSLPAVDEDPERAARVAQYEREARAGREQLGPVMSAVDTAVRGAARAVPFMDDIAAAGRYATGGADSYQDALDRERAINRVDDADRPVTSYGTQIGAGLALPGGALASSGVRGAAAVGAGYGALYGAGQGDGLADRAGRAVTGAAIGGAVGAALPVAGAAAGRGYAAARNAVRGAVPAGRAPAAEVVEAADRIGVALPRAVTTDNMAVQRAAAAARNVPFAGDPLVRASERALTDLGDVAGRTASAVGTVGPESAGRGIRDAIDRAALEAAQQEQAYIASLAQQTREGAADLGEGGVLQAGAGLQDRIGQYANRVAAQEAAPRQAVLQEIGDISGRMGTGDRTAAGQAATAGIGRYANETLPAQQEAAYEAALAGIPRNARTPLQATRDAVAEIAGQRSEARLSDPIGGAARAVAGAIRDRQGLTVSGLQSLRRSIGERLKSPTLDTDMSRGELERIYAALSDDLGNAVRTHGGEEAASAFAQANQLTREGRSAVRDVNSLAQQSPEKAFENIVALAVSGRSGDAARLASIRRMIGGDAFERVEAAAFQKFATDPRTGETSPELLARGIRSLSDEGRAALFGRNAEAVTALARRAEQLAQVAPSAERGIADRLAPLLGGSPERAVEGVLALASSGSRADIARLAELRNVVGEEVWGQVAGSVLRRASFDAQTGAFQPDSLVKFADSLSPQARTILFNEGRGRAAIDAARTIGEQPFNAAKAAAADLARGLGQSDEQAFSRVIAMASSGGRADIAQLARIRAQMAPDEWANISATSIGSLGRDPTGAFSPARFLTDYGKISDAGKKVLFDAASRRALDDIATVSSRFKDLQKFANPSGTAQNLAGGGLVAGVLSEPVATLAAIVGGNVVSRVLAAPASASSAAKWAQAYERMVRRPAAATAAAYQTASRNLAATINADIGASVNVQDFLRALQGPVAGRAEDEQR